MLSESPPGSNEWWDQIKETMRSSGETILGYQKPPKEEWINALGTSLMRGKQLHHKRQSSSSAKSTTASDAYQMKDKNVKHSAEREKREWLDVQTQAAEDAAARNDMRSVYRIAKKVTNSTAPSSSGPGKAKDGGSVGV